MSARGAAVCLGAICVFVLGGLLAVSRADQPGDFTRAPLPGDRACMAQAVPAVPAHAQRVFEVAHGKFYEAGTVVVRTCPGYRDADIPTSVGPGVFFTINAFDALAGVMAGEQAELARLRVEVAELRRSCRR